MMEQKKVYSTDYPTALVSTLEGSEVMIDATALAKTGYKNFSCKFLTYLQTGRASLLVPKSTLSELSRMLDANPELRDNLKTALNSLQFMEDRGYLRYFGSEEDAPAEAIIRHLVLNRKNKQFTVLTQDRKLAYDILEIVNNFKSVTGNAAAVWRLQHDGNLGGFVFDEIVGTPAPAEEFVPSYAATAPAPAADKYRALLDRLNK